VSSAGNIAWSAWRCFESTTSLQSSCSTLDVKTRLRCRTPCRTTQPTGSQDSIFSPTFRRPELCNSNDRERKPHTPQNLYVPFGAALLKKANVGQFSHTKVASWLGQGTADFVEYEMSCVKHWVTFIRIKHCQASSPITASRPSCFQI